MSILRFWLAEAAKDLKDNKTTLEICQQEIMRFGYHPPLIHLFLSALSGELENRFVIREVKANDQIYARNMKDGLRFSLT